MKPKSKIIAAPGADILIPLYARQGDTQPAGFIKLSDLVAADSAFTQDDFDTEFASSLSDALQTQGIDPNSDLGQAVAALVAALASPILVTYQLGAQATLGFDINNFVALTVDAIGRFTLASTSGEYVFQSGTSDGGLRVTSEAFEIDFDNGDDPAVILANAIAAGRLLIGVSLTVDRDLNSCQLVTVAGTNGNLVLTIEGVDYTEAFDTSVEVTVQNWLTTNGAALVALGIAAVEESAGVIKFSSPNHLTISDANSTGDMAGVETLNTTFDLGYTGDTDAFGAAIALTDGELAASETVNLSDITLTSPLYITAAKDIVLTGDVTDFGGGKITITLITLNVQSSIMNP